MLVFLSCSTYLRDDDSVIVKEIVNTNCSYYLPQELNNIICAKSIDFNLSCFHHKCRSFSKHVSEIQCLLKIDTKFDIVSFSQTYFNEETAKLHCIIHFLVIPCFFKIVRIVNMVVLLLS